ncbi:MAG: ABC transporter permease [Alphaproteobacteria bacterium]|nr:ABC transporter permease [Alphaproteobacteria bacterium]
MAQTGVIQSTRSSWLSRGWTVTRVRVVTVVVLFLIWEAMANSGLFYRDVIPSTYKIVIAIARELTDGKFYFHLGYTFLEYVVGFLVGSGIAIATGIVLGATPYLRRVLEPYLNAIGSTPKIIFLPILFLMFGTGIESKMAKGALSAFFPVVFSTILGMVTINPVLLRVGRSFNLSVWQTVAKIYIPAMMNPVITGLRLGMAITVIGIIVAEIKFSDAGVGHRLMQYYEQFQIAPMYAMLLIIFGLAAAANVGMTRFQDNFNRYRTGGKVVRGSSNSLSTR